MQLLFKKDLCINYSTGKRAHYWGYWQLKGNKCNYQKGIFPRPLTDIFDIIVHSHESTSIKAR